MKFFGKDKDASKKDITEQFIGYAGDKYHLGSFTYDSYYKAKKMSTEELVKAINDEEHNMKAYGYLLELRDRKKLSKYPKLEKRYKELKSIPRDLKKLDKTKSPLETLDMPAYAATGLGALIFGLDRLYRKPEKEVVDFLQNMAKKEKLTIKEEKLIDSMVKGLAKHYEPVLKRTPVKKTKVFKETMNALTKDPKIIVNVNKSWGNYLASLFGLNPGPHFQGSDIFGKKTTPTFVRTTPDTASAAHEMGHAINAEKFLKNNPKLKRLYNLAYMDFPLGPIKGVPLLGIPATAFSMYVAKQQVPLLGIPATAFSMYVAKQQAEGGDIPVMPEWMEERPETLVAPAVAPRLFEEATASGRALKQIGQYYKGAKRTKEMAKAISTLAPAFGTYLIGASLPFLGLGAYKKYRTEEEKVKKKYNLKQKTLTDEILKGHA
jgi:hypothetical protein